MAIGFEESDIHANHVEATIDLQWIIHNFVRVHYTTKFVPAVKLGILEIGLKWEDLFKVRYAF